MTSRRVVKLHAIEHQDRGVRPHRQTRIVTARGDVIAYRVGKRGAWRNAKNGAKVEDVETIRRFDLIGMGVPLGVVKAALVLPGGFPGG